MYVWILELQIFCYVHVKRNANELHRINAALFNDVQLDVS